MRMIENTHNINSFKFYINVFFATLTRLQCKEDSLNNLKYSEETKNFLIILLKWLKITALIRNYIFPKWDKNS